MDDLDDIILWHTVAIDGAEDQRLLLETTDVAQHDDDDAAFERWLASVSAVELDSQLSRLAEGTTRSSWPSIGS